MTANKSSWLPNLLGPIDIEVDGVATGVTRRSTINLVGATVSDDPDNERTDVVFQPTTTLANASTGGLNDVASTDTDSLAVGAVRHSGAAPAVTGYASGTAGRRLLVLATGGAVTLANESASSVAANRIVTGTGATVTVANGSGALLVWDATSSRWRLVANGAGSGGSAPSGDYLYKVTGGVMDAASVQVTDALVAAGAAIALSKTALSANAQTFLGTPSSANLATLVSDETGTGALVFANTPTLVTPVLGAATGTSLAASSFVSIGANPAPAGLVRVPAGTTQTIIGKEDGAAGTNKMLSIDASGLLHLGHYGGSVQTQACWYNNSFTFGDADCVELQVLGNYNIRHRASTIEVSKPVVGYATASSPYGVHGGVTHSFASDANYTVTAAQYAYDMLQLNTGSWLSGHDVTFPQPATQAAGYYKTIKNASAYTATIKCGGADSVAMATGVRQRLWFEANGVYAVSAAV